MPKSRGALKKYKTKVVRQKKKKVSGKLRTTLLPTAAELWKEKGTVRSNYAELGISAGASEDQEGCGLWWELQHGKIQLQRSARPNR